MHDNIAVARKFEADLTFDSGTVIGKGENPHPTPLSVMQELVVGGHSFAAADVNFQSPPAEAGGGVFKIKPSSTL